MFDSFRQFVRDLWALPRSVKLLGTGLAAGIGYGAVALTQAGAGAGLWVPLTATVSAAVLLSLGVGWLARRIVRARSRGLATALWERMTRRATPATKAAAEAQRVLQQRWRDVHALLESKDYDYYSLPWYLIVGASQSGKTTLVQRSGQEFPIGDQPVEEFGSTKDCNWFFTNKAILIDTAGRYVDYRLKAERGERERESEAEWLQFLALLRRHRRRKPLNGLILVVKVQDVLTADPGARQRIGEMLRDAMRDVETNLGVRVPVYVMVTMCDRVLGFAEFFRSLGGLTERSLLGWSRSGEYDAAFTPAEFDRGVAHLLQRLMELRLELLRDQRGSAIEPPDTAALDRLYAFPDEFAELAAALRDVLATAFAASTYHQSHFLRGVYFTSSLQKGTPLRELWRRLLGDVSEPPAPEVEPAAAAPDSKPYFVADFFDEKVFREVGLVMPTARTERRRRVAARMGLVGAGASVLTVLGCAVWDIGAIRRPVEVLRTSADMTPTEQDLKQVTEAAFTVRSVAGDREPVDKTLVDRWVKAVHAITSEVGERLGPAGGLHEHLANVAAVLGAEERDLRARLTALYPGGGVERVSDACIASIHGQLQATRETLREALAKAATAWQTVVSRLQSAPETFEAPANAEAWRDLAVAQVHRALADVAQALETLVSQAAANSLESGELARNWKAQMQRLSALRAAADRWTTVVAKDPVRATVEALQGSANAVGANVQFPTLEANVSGIDMDDLAAHESGLRSLGAVVGFDPAESPLLKATVWQLADWKDNDPLPPGLSQPDPVLKQGGLFASVLATASKCRDQLGQRVVRAMLEHIRTSGSLPLASYPYRSTLAVDTPDDWKSSQFSRAAAAAAARLFANLRKRAQGNADCIASAEGDYVKRFKDYWLVDLVNEIHRVESPTDVNSALRILRDRRLGLPAWIERLGAKSDAGTGSDRRQTQDLIQWIVDLDKKCPIKDTAEAAQGLDALADACAHGDVEQVLRTALGAREHLQRAINLPDDGPEPLRKAVRARASETQRALGVLANEVFRQRWVAPTLFRTSLFPLDGGVLLGSARDDQHPLHADELEKWFSSENLQLLAELVWPAYDPTHKAYRLFVADHVAGERKTCFVALMQLRAILTAREPVIVLTSESIESPHTLRAPGEVGIVVDDRAAKRVSPNNFRVPVPCSGVASKITFQLRRGADTWEVPMAIDRWLHFRVLAFLYGNRESARDGTLSCRVVFLRRESATEMTPAAAAHVRTEDRESLWFRASIEGLRFPDQLPDLGNAGFFKVSTTEGN